MSGQLLSPVDYWPDGRLCPYDGATLAEVHRAIGQATMFVHVDGTRHQDAVAMAVQRVDEWECPQCHHALIPISRRRWRNWFRKTIWRACVRPGCDWMEQTGGPAVRSRVNP